MNIRYRDWLRGKNRQDRFRIISIGNYFPSGELVSGQPVPYVPGIRFLLKGLGHEDSPDDSGGVSSIYTVQYGFCPMA